MSSAGATPTKPPTCAANPASKLASTGGSGQVILVEASDYGTDAATVTTWQRQGSCWVGVNGPWPALIGANGFSDHHAEGDDTTPTGAYGIGPVMYGNTPNPGVRYPYHQLVCGDWWDEDPASPEYNTFQHIGCGTTPPFLTNSEPLWKETAAYPSLAVIDYNTAPVVPGAGSGIFIHAEIGTGTAGCVSIPQTDLDTLLRWLDPAESPRVIMGPASEIQRF